MSKWRFTLMQMIALVMLVVITVGFLSLDRPAPIYAHSNRSQFTGRVAALSAQIMPTNVISSYVTIEFNRNAPFPGEAGVPWPRGYVTLGGVPFHIPEQDPSVWKSEDPYVTGPNPRMFDMPVNQP